MKSVVRTVSVLLLLAAATALPREEDEERSKETRSPAVEGEEFSGFQEEQPAEFSLGNLFSGRVGKFLNDFLQFPAAVLRFVSGIIANQPFAKLREEVRNLNISYPK